ncbi:MAG: hypothetical protein HRU35_04180 [Rickettsiaceae bacterium]|nr:hypothetical protein [Rickettsiaceae bacterium]
MSKTNDSSTSLIIDKQKDENNIQYVNKHIKDNPTATTLFLGIQISLSSPKLTMNRCNKLLEDHFFVVNLAPSIYESCSAVLRNKILIKSMAYYLVNNPRSILSLDYYYYLYYCDQKKITDTIFTLKLNDISSPIIPEEQEKISLSQEYIHNTILEGIKEFSLLHFGWFKESQEKCNIIIPNDIIMLTKNFCGKVFATKNLTKNLQNLIELYCKDFHYSEESFTVFVENFHHLVRGGKIIEHINNITGQLFNSCSNSNHYQNNDYYDDLNDSLCGECSKLSWPEDFRC